LERLKKFIANPQALPLSAFLEKKLNVPHEGFELADNERFSKLIVFRDEQMTKWRGNALDYFLDTQFGFASLIEGDKRDASDKHLDNYYHLEAVLAKNTIDLAESLAKKWVSLATKAGKSELDKLRTAIREEAVANLQPLVEHGQRVFTLTAPTGAGKTFTLLALAAEIQRQKPESGLSILYAIPFLSITEQVEEIARSLFADAFDVLTASSKSKNERLDNLIEKLDDDPEAEDFKELLKLDFIAQTFDHPFIVTTFVQFFETLLSNRNSTLLKLPNFSRRIFLIDEVQALPPRLYIFFTAWLEAFCRRWNSYAIISTATMPKVDFLDKPSLDDVKKPGLLFKGYLNPENYPKELLNTEKFFSQTPFNRYRIRLMKPFEVGMDELVEAILNQKKSCLVILNTIKDSKALYKILREKGVNASLLNTHFIPTDRKQKIEQARIALKAEEKIVLVSTQLIEAGVDVDFPVVFRDLCPLPSLIQSAGRCNRNKKADFGDVWFFHLKHETGKSGAYAVYRDEAQQFLEFSQKHISDKVEEKDLLGVQSKFFDFIRDSLTIGAYEIDGENENLIELVNRAAFEKLGRFKLIQEKTFGFEFQYFIRENYDDKTYEEAVDLLQKVLESIDFKTKREWKIRLTQQLKKVTERTVTIRVFEKSVAPDFSNRKEYFDIRVLGELSLYTFENGFEYDSSEGSIL
jgi:CRISPR-associated endonuclease/helicase Cas3